MDFILKTPGREEPGMEMGQNENLDAECDVDCLIKIKDDLQLAMLLHEEIERQRQLGYDTIDPEPIREMYRMSGMIGRIEGIGMSIYLSIYSKEFIDGFIKSSLDNGMRQLNLVDVKPSWELTEKEKTHPELLELVRRIKESLKLDELEFTRHIKENDSSKFYEKDAYNSKCPVTSPLVTDVTDLLHNVFSKISQMLVNIFIQDSTPAPAPAPAPAAPAFPAFPAAPAFPVLKDKYDPSITNRNMMLLLCYFHGGKIIIDKKFSTFIPHDIKTMIMTAAYRGGVQLANEDQRYVFYYEMTGFMSNPNRAHKYRYREYGSFQDFLNNQLIRPYPFNFDDYFFSTAYSITQRIFGIHVPSSIIKNIIQAFKDEFPSYTAGDNLQIMNDLILRNVDSLRLTAVTPRISDVAGNVKNVIIQNTSKNVESNITNASAVAAAAVASKTPAKKRKAEAEAAAAAAAEAQKKLQDAILNRHRYNQPPSMVLRDKILQPDHIDKNLIFNKDYRLTTSIVDLLTYTFPRNPLTRYLRYDENGLTDRNSPGPYKFYYSNIEIQYNNAFNIQLLNDFLKYEDIKTEDLIDFIHHSPRDISVLLDIQFDIPTTINELTGAMFIGRHVVIRAGESFIANPHIIEWFILMLPETTKIGLKPILDKEKSSRDDGRNHYDPEVSDNINADIPQTDQNYVYVVQMLETTYYRIYIFLKNIVGIEILNMIDNSCDTLDCIRCSLTQEESDKLSISPTQNEMGEADTGIGTHPKYGIHRHIRISAMPGGKGGTKRFTSNRQLIQRSNINANTKQSKNKNRTNLLRTRMRVKTRKLRMRIRNKTMNKKRQNKKT